MDAEWPRISPVGEDSAEAVILGASDPVREDIVGVGDFLEPLFGLKISRIPIWMELEGLLAVGLLQFVGAGASGDLKQLVEVGLQGVLVRMSTL